MEKSVRVNRKKNVIRVSKGERVFYIVNYCVLTLLGVTALYPFLITLANSLSGSRAILAGEVVLFPVDFSLEAYYQITAAKIFDTMANTVYLTIIGTGLNMLVTIMSAYPLSKKNFPGKNLCVTILTITMFFGGGLIPTFILMKSLHLMDTYLCLWLLGLFSMYNMIILRTFFSGLPLELEESAKIDGANDIVVLIRIALPLSKAVLATLTLFYAVGWWNSYMSPLLYISSPDKAVLMLKLKQLLDQSQLAQNHPEEIGVVRPVIAPESFKAASIIVSTVPILCVYPFLQKYFVKGVMIGSIKG